MIRRLKLGAIGGLLVAGALLLIGVVPVRADELADLRANQQLLQQRIDQLAQAQAQAGVSGPPAPLTGGAGGGEAIGISGMRPASGIPVGGGSFPRSFLIPGTDTSIRVGGFVDFTTLYFLNGGGNVNGSNYGSNSGQNGTLVGLPLTGGVVPGLGFVASSLNAHPSRNNGIWEFSVQQSRLDIETRTPTAWGEARTFFAFDWAGCDNYSCQDLQQGGGDSIHPRLRFAYGTLGGFLAGQALSNFSDADADTESIEFGNVIGSTGGQRIPQVRYTIPGPYGSAFSVSAENPWTAVITPGGLQSSDFAVDGVNGTSTTPPDGIVGPICNGIACTGAGGAQANPAVTKLPSLTFASYWAQPWGHVDFAGVVSDQTFRDGAFVNQSFLGVGGHVAGDVHPGWWGYTKDDFLFSFVYGNAIGAYASGGLNTFYPVASNFTVTTACATPTKTCTGGMAASNVLFNPVTSFSTHGGYQHWWLPNLRSTVAAGFARQDISSQLIGPTQAIGTNKVLWNAFVNLVWNPVAFITTGVEYMYGKRVVVANLTGNENVLVYKFRVAF